MFDTFPWQNKSSSYVCRMLNIVTARRAQKKIAILKGLTREPLKAGSYKQIEVFANY